ncbi:MAG TPA: hypothetical protein VFH24_07350 [Gemmatimonadales bacterium]|nr:hypothetical protein [Gemmatimonadales bacterium]
MLDIVELGEAGIRAFGFWLWLFSPKYRAQVAQDWHAAGGGRRLMLGFEYLISVVLGLGAPVLVLVLLAGLFGCAPALASPLISLATALLESA